jgi:glycosyltransferase involved in cell wall biosynthesis
MPEVVHVFNYAEKSANQNNDVTLLCVDDQISLETIQDCKKRGFNCECVKRDIEEERISLRNTPFLQSYAVWKWLRNRHYDIIHFADFRGLGYHAIQDNRTTGGFHNTTLIVDMYGPSQWRLERNSDWGYGGFEQLMVHYMERYTCQYCDGLVEIAEGGFKWAMDRRWELSVEKYSTDDVILNKKEQRKICNGYEPLISICIAYYNHGEYLGNALKSLLNNTYKNIEIIVVNDGSNDEQSINIFNELKKEYLGSKLLFIDKKNEGPSITRNYAANKASGEYIIFMDADNIAKPDMIKKYVAGVLRGFDCLSCYFDHFMGTGTPPKVASAANTLYTLMGPSLETGIFMNCFGDTNFIIKRDLFLRLDGFMPQRVVTEDWQFLARLALAGYHLDVIPYPLFWYRVLESSNINYGSEYYKQRLIIETFCKELPPFVYHVFVSLCRPTLKPSENPISSETYRKIKDKFNHYFPRNSLRRKYILRLIRKILKN